MAIIASWFNDYILKMIWLKQIVDGFFGEIIGLNPDQLLYQALTFFFYDLIKIIILLSVLIFISSFIQASFTPEKTKKILSKHHGLGANVLGALLGTLTPFCSCSSIPIFMGFTRAGLPIGVTFSFLISSPLVDLASVMLLSTIFGWKIALAYVLVGLLIAVIGGTLIQLFHMEKYIESFVLKSNSDTTVSLESLTLKQRFGYSIDQVKEIIKRVWLYLIIGVGIGAIIHGYIPQSWIEAVLGANNPFSVLIATSVGIPMYADIFGTLPIAEALVQKGVQIGTVLAFMMAVTALSLPSMILLKKVVKTKLLLMFFSIVTAGILMTGYLFNLLKLY